MFAKNIAVYCDYYNKQGHYSWHYEVCGEGLTCGNENYVHHKLEGNGSSQLHPVDAKSSYKQVDGYGCLLKC